jgi:hypothetical protein
MATTSELEEDITRSMQYHETIPIPICISSVRSLSLCRRYFDLRTEYFQQKDKVPATNLLRRLHQFAATADEGENF